VKVYRIQATSASASGQQWVTTWSATLADAKAQARYLRDAYDEVVVEQMEIGSGREGVVDALKSADVNRTTWPGQRVRT
jgi:hypothetical protein